MEDIEARFVFFKEGTPTSGYRPAHLIKENYLTTGLQQYDPYIEKNNISGTITFISPDVYPNSVWKGKRIPFYEGKTIVGYAVVKKVCNQILLKKYITKEDLKSKTDLPIDQWFSACLLSFDVASASDDVAKKVEKIFEEGKITIQRIETLGDNKKSYYHEFLRHYVYEIQKDNLLEDMILWSGESGVSEVIDSFVNVLKELKEKCQICPNIIISSFAVENKTSITHIEGGIDSLNQDLFRLSVCCSDMIDNLVLSIK